MKTTLITGGGRGLGLAFVKACLDGGDRVIATVRSPERAEALRALKAHHTALGVVKLDVADTDSIAAFAGALEIDRLDRLINNAGINGRGVPEGQSNVRWGSLEPEGILQMVRVNACGPLLVTQALDGLLGEGAVVMNVSSWLGSIARKESGGNYGYCASKATLNMMTRAMAGDLKARGILVVSANPGWVQTDMGGQRASLTPDQSVKGLLDTLDGLTLADTGAFIQHDGERHAW